MENIRTGKSLIAEASWYSKILYHWTFPIINKAQTEKITLEDFGGLVDDHKIQYRAKAVEEEFESQGKDRNIFLAVFKVFKWNFFYSFFGCMMNMTIHICFPKIIAEIIKFLEDKEDRDFTYGMQMICLLSVLTMIMMVNDCHVWYNNLTTGCLCNKIIK